MPTKTLEFKEKTFEIWYLETYATHPTWYTFEDEKDVREAWWDPMPGELVVDVGACCGSYTLTALACGADVVAYAPGDLQEGLRETVVLENSIRLNNWQGNGHVLATGLYSSEGWLDTRTLELNGTPGDRYSIYVYPLDDETFDIGLEWIKIDVEGAELEVLKGARETIRENRPKILVEHHLFKNERMVEEVSGYLEGLNYRLEGTIPHAASRVVHGLYVPRER